MASLAQPQADQQPGLLARLRPGLFVLYALLIFWAIVELLGHVRLAGKLTEEDRFGGKLGRLDIPNKDGFTTVFFGGGSVYKITAVSQEAARAAAAQNQPEPVHSWEMPKALSHVATPSFDEAYGDEADS